MQLKSILAVSALLMSSVTYAALPIKNISDENRVKVTLDLDASRFSISGGCNVMNGSVAITEEGVFTTDLSRIATTMMACSEPLTTMSKRIEGLLANQPKIIRQAQALYLIGTIEGEVESVYIPITLDKGSYKDITAETYEKVFVYVSHETVPCTTDATKQCLQIRDKKEDKWQVYEGTIEGFNPEPNIAYRLRLKEYDKGLDKARWVFDMMVEQEVIK